MRQSFWIKILGEPKAFSLEARIFNAICLISAIGLFFTAFLNLILGIQQLVVLMLTVFFIAITCYYYSRVKMMLNTSIIVYMIAINFLLAVNFKYNSGISGPSLLIFVLSFFLTISIVPRRQYWFWIALNILMVNTLLALEYQHQGLIMNTYIDAKSRFIDFAATYVFIVFFIFLVTIAVRKSYHTEKGLVEQKAKELEIANNTKNKLFSILAHDLRSPLASIQNYLEILLEVKLDENERLSINQSLLASTRNTEQMLSNLLLWSKAQMQGVTVNRVKVNLKETLMSTFQIHQVIATEKGIQLTDEIKSNVFIEADPDMLQLVIRNLINNAIKFTAPGGEIIVSDELADHMCHIIIKDNGMGIPYDEQANIFSIKVTSAFGTKNEKGFGLGLVLCKEFTELQNGKISFESTPGKGSTFYVSFPLFPGANDVNIPGNSALVKEV